VLAQLRETNGAAEPFAPSRHERHFSAMLDAAVSREIVGASGWGLVDRIETTLARRARATREAMGDV
jgi:Rod binding domain-containing protein